MKTWQRLRQQPELWSRYLVREQVVDATRAFFKQQGFHEVETPLLVEHPGTEPYLEVFETKLHTEGGKQRRAFLLTSPEFAMKKLLVAGSGNIFQICKSFRNYEGESSRHNPEFTIMEWYRTPGDYRDIMTDCEQLVQAVWRSVHAEEAHTAERVTLEYQGRRFELQSPWPRLSVAEAFAKYVGVDTDDLLSFEGLKTAALKRGYQVELDTTWEQLYNQLFLNEIEPKLAEYDKPVFLYDYPASQAALSKKKLQDPRFAERFELYVGGLELANAFSELADPEEQADRFREELTLRRELGKIPYDMDEDYIAALSEGLPPTGGIALGIDRLVMLFANAESIEDTLFFPVRDVFAGLGAGE